MVKYSELSIFQIKTTNKCAHGIITLFENFLRLLEAFNHTLKPSHARASDKHFRLQTTHIGSQTSINALQNHFNVIIYLASYSIVLTTLAEYCYHSKSYYMTLYVERGLVHENEIMATYRLGRNAREIDKTSVNLSFCVVVVVVVV